MEKIEQQLMTPMKEKIINYILKFILGREREVRTSDLFEEIMKQFGSELKNKCDDNPFADEMFAESVIHETYRLYGLTYTEKDDKLIGLKEEGYKAANHPNGIAGYLDNKEKERKSLELRKRIESFGGMFTVFVGIISFIIDYISPNSTWANSLAYLSIGILIGLAVTRIF